MRSNLVRCLAALAVALTLAACATNPALVEGRQLLGEGRADAALDRLERGLKETPDDAEMRQTYYRQRELLLASQLAAADSARAAGRNDEASVLYKRVLGRDAANVRAAEGLQRIANTLRHASLYAEAQNALKKNDRDTAETRLRDILAAEPSHAAARALLARVIDENAREQARTQALKSPFGQPVTLEFRDATLRSVFEVISRSSGLNFVFDKDVRSDTKVTLFVRQTTLEDVVRLILSTNQLERKLLNDNSVLIYPNTPAKAREYEDLVVKTFYLSNVEAKQAQVLVRSMVKTRDVFIDDKLNVLVVRDTPEAIRLVERLIASIDIAEPEVMLDVEVLEVSRNRLLELGLRFPDQIGYGLLQPTITNTTIVNNTTQTTTNLGGQLQQGFINTRELNASVPFVANPALLLNLKSQDGDANLLANPRIRVRSKEKAKVHIGEKLPVFTTTSTANVGVSASVNYLDVGLKLEVEPTVYLDDEVAIKVGLEVSSIVKEIAGPSNSLAYQVGTRSAATVLRLKNGETQVLAGLISDEERTSANRLPGLGNIPLLGRLFSSTRDSSNKTEIVLLITPRIVRNIARPDDSSYAVPAGTAAAAGAPALSIRPTAARSLGLSSQGGGSAPRAPALFEGGSGPALGADADLAPSFGGAASANPPSGPEAGQVLHAVLTAPAQAALGGEFSIAINIAGAAQVVGAQADVAFDVATLTPIGAAAVAGRATVPLSPASGALSGELRFRVKALTAGSASVSLAAVRALDATGATLPVSLPAPSTITLAP